MTDFGSLKEQLVALCEGVELDVSNLANASALIYNTMESLNWAGFYLAKGKVLYLGPFQGKPACTKIPFERGVCGKAAREGKTVLVKNVHEFEGHIACDCASNSEIVVPIFKNGALYGVLDIDSPLIARFVL